MSTAEELIERAVKSKQKRCPQCGHTFEAASSNGRQIYCSDYCCQAAHGRVAKE